MKKKSLSAKKPIHKKLLINLEDPLINKIYKDFNNFIKINLKNSNFSVAISGGVDSLALAYFSKCYSISNNIKVKYYHVNHKLRKESSLEAKKLKFLLKKFDINCKILNWIGLKPKSNIQSVARIKRYDLIYNECMKDKINFVFIAHHIDDLYENFIIRLLRGSGLKGLVSFNQIKTNYGGKLNILRPLIVYKKTDLNYVTKKIFNFKFEDPSNKNINFKRVRIRNLINDLKTEGLDEKKLKMTINNLTQSDLAINHYVNKNIKLNSNIIDLKNKTACLIKKEFFDQPEEVIFRSFSIILINIGEKYYAPRGKSLTEIIKKIKSNKPTKLTLSGCIIEKLNNSLIIYQEKRKKSKK